MACYFFEQALVIPGDLVDVVADALTEHIRREDRAGRPVDPDLRAFVSALGQTLSVAGPSATMDTSSTFLGAAEVAQRTGTSERHVRRQCSAGQFPGAHLISGRWVIPVDSIPQRRT